MKTYRTLLLIFLAALLTGACSHAPKGPPMGTTLKQLTAAQAVNPQAPVNSAPVAQIPGSLGLQLYNNVYLQESSGSDQ